MGRFAICLLALVLACGSAAAQQDTVTPKSSKADFALLFDLGGLSNLALRSFTGISDTSESGAGFGAKYFIDNDIALRLSLLVSSSSISIPQGPDSLGRSDKLTVLRLGIAPALLVNIVKSGPVAGYVGGELGYQLQKSSREMSDTSAVNVDATAGIFGAAGVIGAEWFPWHQVSISGEYRLGVTMTSSSREEHRGTRPSIRYEDPSETSFALASRGTITLGIYW